MAKQNKILKRYLLIILTVGLLVISAVIVFKNHNNLLSKNEPSPKTNPNVIDISNEFIITPNKNYSLRDKKIIIPPTRPWDRIVPEQIIIVAKFNNFFSKPIWAKGRNCDDQGALERKTMMGWVVADEGCYDEVPGTFFNYGVVGELYHTIFTKGARGFYRIRINLLYGCRADSKDIKDNIIYGGCKEAISYSPVFTVH